MTKLNGSDPVDSVVALVPAAGRASRLRGLPGSKEIYPVDPFRPAAGAVPRPRPVCEYLLEALVAAGVRQAYVILRPGKWDIPEHLGALELDIDLAYLTIPDSPSVVHTLDRAFPFIQDRRVALGFPDIVFQPREAFQRVLERQQATGAQVVLGLFPTDQGHRSDMVEMDAEGRARRIVVKQPGTELRFMWSIAIWTPRFTDYLHRFLERSVAFPQAENGRRRELFVGDVVQAAIDDGLEVQTVVFAEGSILDVGTPEGLRQATRQLVDPNE